MKAKNSSVAARWCSILVLALAFLHCLSFSWLKWGDVLVDLGRDLDTARQIAEGRSLYSQVRYVYGPFAPLLNGLLFKLCGVQLAVFTAAGILVALVSCVLLYRLARLFCGRLGSTSIAAAFLYVCAFAHLTPNGIFNFVLPYTTAATYGMCSALASLYFLLHHARKARRLDLVLSLVFLVVAALTKIEILFATALAHLVFLACGLWWRVLPSPPPTAQRLPPAAWGGGDGAAWRLYLCAYAAAFLAAASVYGVFIFSAGWDCVFHDNLFMLLGLPHKHYSLDKMGLLAPAESLALMGYSALAAGSVFSLAYLAGRVARHSPAARVCALAAAAVGGACVYGFLSLELPFRLLPALCAGVFVYLLVRWLRKPDERPALLAQLVLLAFALGSIARLGLQVVSYHYGFYLLPAGLLAFGLLWFAHLPRWFAPARTDGQSPESPSPFPLPRRGGGWGRASAPAGLRNTAFTAAGAGIFCALIWGHYAESSRLYGLHTAALDAPRGHMLLLDNLRGLRKGPYEATVVHLLSRMPPHTRVIVVPQGVGLTFLSGQDNPYGTFGYTLFDFAGSYSDEHVLELLKAQPPELVVNAASDTSEYGPQVFGKDYAVKCWAWINENYQFGAAIGKPSFAVIYGRKGVDCAPLLQHTPLKNNR